MESWENKMIADKLNSLQDLPDGYEPTISSKWEIIEAGLQNKKKRPAVRWWTGTVLLVCAGVLCWYIVSKKVPINDQIVIELPKEKRPTFLKKIEQPATSFSVTTPKSNTSNVKKARVVKKRTLASDSLRFKPAAVQSISRPVDSMIQMHPDTLKIAPPIVNLKIQKPGRKVFQKDFESIATRIDSPLQKTAAKGVQLKWRISEEKPATSDEPRLRLTQKF